MRIPKIYLSGLSRHSAMALARELFSGEVRGNHVKHSTYQTMFCGQSGEYFSKDLGDAGKAGVPLDPALRNRPKKKKGGTI